MKISLNKSQELQKYSQSSEETIINQLLPLIQRRKQKIIAVEFGASEGNDGSNLLALAHLGVSTVFIEADSNKFVQLKNNTKNLLSVQLINDRVGFIEGKNLRSILESYKINTSDVAIVSIDVDGDDAVIFENLGFHPDCVVIEFNPTMSADGRFRNPPGRNIGNSIGELLFVAEALGYYPVGITDTNLILLDKYYTQYVKMININEEILQTNKNLRIGWGYDGTIVMYPSRGGDIIGEVYQNWWNGSILVQPLPKSLRKFKSGKIHYLLFLSYVIIFRPNYLYKIYLKSTKLKS